MEGVLSGIEFLNLIAETSSPSLIAILKEPDLNLPFPVLTYRFKPTVYKDGQVVPFFFALNRPHYKIKKYDRLPTRNIQTLINWLKPMLNNIKDDVFCWNLGVLLLMTYLTHSSGKPLPRQIPLFKVVALAVEREDTEVVQLILELIEVLRGGETMPYGRDLYPLLTLTLTYKNFEERGAQFIYKWREFVAKFAGLLRLVSERGYVGVDLLPIVKPRRPERIPFTEP